MSGDWDDEPVIDEPARRDPGITQNVREALDRIGYPQRPESRDMSLPESGLDLARHITSASGVAGLLAVVFAVGMMGLVWVLLGRHEDALGTVATHQSAMQRRLDQLTASVEDLEREVRLSRAPAYGPYVPRPGDTR